jgi:hypothetical protein
MSSGMILFRQRVAILFEPACWLLFIWLLQSQKNLNKVFVFSIIAMYGMILSFIRTRNDIFYQYDNFLLYENVISIEKKMIIHETYKLEKNFE